MPAHQQLKPLSHLAARPKSAKIIKAPLPQALSEAGMPAIAIEPYATGSNAASVSDLTLEQAIGVQVRQLRPPGGHYRLGTGGSREFVRRHALENREWPDIPLAGQPAGIGERTQRTPYDFFFDF